MSVAPHTPASSETDLVGHAADQPLSSPPSEGEAGRSAAMQVEALRAGKAGVEDVDVQLPEYVPPWVIVIGPLAEPASRTLE